MPSYYTPAGGGSSSGSGYKPEKVGGGGQLNISEPEPTGPTGGKGSIDLLDFGSSVAETAGSFAEFGSGLVGGVAGAIGSIGFGDGANIGAVADVPGNVLGAVGSVPLPRVGEGPNATVGDIPGKALELVSLPGKAVERTVAGQRAEGTHIDLGAALGAGPLGPITNLFRMNPDEADAELPPDLQARLDAGESVDVIADEMVARGAGYSSNPGTNLAGQFLFDPLNLIAPGLSKAGAGIRAAGLATRSAEDFARLNIPQKAAGIAYATASRGMAAGSAAFVDKAIGPVTSGALHALGSKPYQRFTSGFGKLDRSYGENLHNAAGVANANLMNAVIADDIATDAAASLARLSDDLDPNIGARLSARRSYKPDELERRAEELLARTVPEFLGQSADELTDFTVRAMAMAADTSIEDAARVVGRASVQDAQTAHWVRYGKAIDEFGPARAEAIAAAPKNIDANRLTLIADDTLTTERAKALLASAPGTLHDEAMKYEILRNYFLGKVADDGKIIDFVKKLQKEGALHEAVRLPKTGKNKLPSALSDFRTKWRDNGYDIGFAPKDGLKTITDADGNVLWAKPFVNLTTRVDPVTVRNPLGRAMDGMFRGITQTTIVQQSRQRMTRMIADAKLPISPNQVRSIHKAIIDEAADRSLTPRALVGERTGGQVIYNDIFKRFLTDDEYQALIDKWDPTYVVMRAFEGNLKTVGLTQKFTGRAKVIPGIAKIAEALYPKARFTYRPTFQLQEAIESPALNALRGVTQRPVADDLAQAYAKLAEQPEFKFLTEASYLNIAGDRLVQQYMGANTKLGRAFGRFTNIQSRKETARISQVMYEHGEEFKTAVSQIDPRAWKAMEEAYGTKDPKAIADMFLQERMRLGMNENIDDAMAAVDEVHDEAIAAIQQTLDGTTIRTGQEAASQAANVAAGVARGGTAASGGAVRGASQAIPNDRAAEMVWQAFKDSFRQSSVRAFQTHFFNPQRGWLERSLNHPYLGIYPLSYMWGKVLPEFARFLIARPFGMKAPLTGYAGLERVQQAYIGALADDPEFAQFIQENPNSIYFANLLFPGNPTNLTANTPAYARHIVEDLRGGKDVNLNTVSREVADTGSYALGPVNDATSVSKAASDLIGSAERLFANLDKAAREYDGQFTGTPLIQR